MTYKCTYYGQVASANGMSSGPIGSKSGFSADDVVDEFDAVVSKGGHCIITDERGFFVDARSLGWSGDWTI